MKDKAKLICIATALVVASASMTAQAAKPVSKERQAAIAKIAKNHRNFQQPRTMADASRTEVVQSDGTVGIAVPEELWNEMSARSDAQGNLRMSESDGSDAASANATTETVINE